MYYCDTCHVASKVKPHNHRNCDYCGTDTISQLSKKVSITIEDIDLNSSFYAINNEFANISNHDSNAWGRKYLYQRSEFAKGNNRPFGFISDNITEFMDLESNDLDKMWIKLYGKSNLNYYTFPHVRIKCSLFTHYIMMPMHLTTMIDWFRDHEKTYHIHFNKTVWSLEHLSGDDVITPMITKLDNNAKSVSNSGSRYYNSQLLFIS